MGGFTR